jgi:hypothetical protein
MYRGKLDSPYTHILDRYKLSKEAKIETSYTHIHDSELSNRGKTNTPNTQIYDFSLIK